MFHVDLQMKTADVNHFPDVNIAIENGADFPITIFILPLYQQVNDGRWYTIVRPKPIFTKRTLLIVPTSHSPNTINNDPANHYGPNESNTVIILGQSNHMLINDWVGQIAKYMLIKSHVNHMNQTGWGPQDSVQLPYKWLKMVDTTIVTGSYFMVYKPTTISGGPHLEYWVGQIAWSAECFMNPPQVVTPGGPNAPSAPRQVQFTGETDKKKQRRNSLTDW